VEQGFRLPSLVQQWLGLVEVVVVHILPTTRVVLQPLVEQQATLMTTT
jgi:hypothetical protein